MNIIQVATGIVWYRKHFKLPGKDINKKVFLEFEGIRFGGELYINGKPLAIHENGGMAFGFGITDYLNSNGKGNVIAVRIDNAWDYKEKATGISYQWNDHNFIHMSVSDVAGSTTDVAIGN